MTAEGGEQQKIRQQNHTRRVAVSVHTMRTLTRLRRAAFRKLHDDEAFREYSKIDPTVSRLCITSIATTFYFTTRLEILTKRKTTDECARARFEKFPMHTKLLESRVRIRRGENAAASWRSESNWRRRSSTLRRPPRLPSAGTPTPTKQNIHNTHTKHSNTIL